jgi:hypothetical protein
MADEKTPNEAPENMDFSSFLDKEAAAKEESFATEFDMDALGREEQKRKEPNTQTDTQTENKETSLADAMNGATEVFTEADMQALEKEEKLRKEPLGEQLPAETIETLRKEFEAKKKAEEIRKSEELAAKISQNPLEVFTEEDLKAQEQEEANRKAGGTDNKNNFYDELYNENSVIGDPPVLIGETLDTDTINQLRGNTGNTQEPPPPPPVEKNKQEEPQPEEEPKQEEKRGINTSALDLNKGTITSPDLDLNKFDRKLDPDAIGAGGEDPMLAFMSLLKSMGDEGADFLAELSLHRLKQVEARMDAKDFTLEKPTGNNITSNTGKTEVDAEDIVTGLSYWTLYANKMAGKANIGGAPLLSNNIISTSVAENKMHKQAWIDERDQNAVNMARNIENTTLKSTPKDERKESKGLGFTNTIQKGDSFLTKTKKAFNMTIATVTLGEFGKSAFNPQRSSETIIFPNLMEEGMRAAKKGDMEGLKKFVSKTDAIMEKLETNVAEKLGLPADYTPEDLQKKAQDSDNPEVQSCVDGILAYSRGSLIAEKKFLEEDLISSKDNLRQEANRRDALMKKAGMTKDNAALSVTNNESPRDIIRSAAIHAEEYGGLETKEGMTAFKSSLPSNAAALSDEEYKELGNLSVKTDKDAKAISNGETKGLGIAEERIQEITKAYFPEAKNIQQGIQEQKYHIGELDSLLSAERRTEIARGLTENHNNTAADIKNPVLEDAIADQQQNR